MEKGQWLLEVFSVLYKGRNELKPKEQIGTIKVNDGIHDHYLYKVGRTGKSKPSIQHLDEVVLTGPRIASISAMGSFTIDVDLFCGAYKDSLCINNCPTNESFLTRSPLEKRIRSKDGRGEIRVLFSIYDNATEAHVEVQLVHGDDFNTEVYGVVAASTSEIEALECSSMLFVKKPSDKIKLGRGKPFPLSRSIVAVPLDSELFVDMHLMNGKKLPFFEGAVKFAAERNVTRKQVVLGKKCKIKVTVTWK